MGDCVVVQKRSRQEILATAVIDLIDLQGKLGLSKYGVKGMVNRDCNMYGKHCESPLTLYIPSPHSKRHNFRAPRSFDCG